MKTNLVHRTAAVCRHHCHHYASKLKPVAKLLTQVANLSTGLQLIDCQLLSANVFTSTNG